MVHHRREKQDPISAHHSWSIYTPNISHTACRCLNPILTLILFVKSFTIVQNCVEDHSNLLLSSEESPNPYLRISIKLRVTISSKAAVMYKISPCSQRQHCLTHFVHPSSSSFFGPTAPVQSSDHPEQPLPHEDQDLAPQIQAAYW